MKKPEYTWNPELGIAGCTIYYKDIEFYGSAVCHPDDEDMMSKLTGQIIAEARATIAYLVHIRDNEIRPQLKALYQLYYSMKHSKNFTPRSYEAIMLYKQIHHLENDLTEIKLEIANIKKNLKEYIEQKDKDHKAIRSFQQKKLSAEDNQ